MKHQALVLALAITLFAVSACTKKPEPTADDNGAEETYYADEEESNYERAERVGDVGDATVTHGLKSSLTGALKAQEEHDAAFEEVGNE